MIDFSAVGPDTFAGKVVRFPFRLLPRGMTVPILQGPLRGKKWILGSQRHAFWLGSYEPHIQRLMVQELKKGSTFYDIGANVGFYSLLASFLVAPGKVFAFELSLKRNSKVHIVSVTDAVLRPCASCAAYRARA